MSQEDAYQLNQVQSAYEQDPSNAQYAYEYFQQLNKHQFYLTVVREYEAFNNRSTITDRKFGQWAVKLTQ